MIGLEGQREFLVYSLLLLGRILENGDEEFVNVVNGHMMMLRCNAGLSVLINGS